MFYRLRSNDWHSFTGQRRLPESLLYPLIFCKVVISRCHPSTSNTVQHLQFLCSCNQLTSHQFGRPPRRRLPAEPLMRADCRATKLLTKTNARVPFGLHSSLHVGFQYWFGPRDVCLTRRAAAFHRPSASARPRTTPIWALINDYLPLSGESNYFTGQLFQSGSN